jgi:uncharacterized protein (TIGR00369 family)
VSVPTHAHGPFQELVGYETLTEGDRPYLRLHLRRDLLNPHGVLHGGVSLTLLDAIGGRSLVGQLVPATGQRILSSVTVTLTTDFMLGVRDGVLFATGSPDHIGKTVAYVSVELRHNAMDGPLVARGLGTYRVYTRSLVSPV